MVTNNRSILDGLTAGNGTSDNAYLDNLEKEKSLRRSWYQTKTPTSDADLAAAEKLTNQSLNDLYKTPQPTQNQQSGIAATTTTSTQPAQNVQPLKPVASPQSIGATMPVSNDGAIKKNSLASNNPLAGLTEAPGKSYIDATTNPMAPALTNVGSTGSIAGIRGIQNNKVYKTLDANGRAVFTGTDGSTGSVDGRTDAYKQEVADRNANYLNYMATRSKTANMSYADQNKALAALEQTNKPYDPAAQLALDTTRQQNGINAVKSQAEIAQHNQALKANEMQMLALQNARDTGNKFGINSPEYVKAVSILNPTGQAPDKFTVEKLKNAGDNMGERPLYLKNGQPYVPNQAPISTTEDPNTKEIIATYPDGTKTKTDPKTKVTVPYIG